MRAIKAILLRNLIKFGRNRMRLVFTIFMSVSFLFIFSFAMKSAAANLAQPMNYLISGIIIMTVFQTALNNSMSILEDISGGFMKEILVAPIARWQIAVGQILSSAIIAVLQGIIIILMGFFMGFRTDMIHFLGMIGVMILVGVTFSSIGLFLAAVSKESTTFQIMITVVSLPLTFLSGAYIPTVVLPKILYPVVFLNPLTYTTAIFRYLALRMGAFSPAQLIKAGVAFDVHGIIVMPYTGALIVFGIGAVFFGLCVRQFSSADFSRVKAVHRHR